MIRIPITRNLSTNISEIVGRIEIEEAVAEELAKTMKAGGRYTLDAVIELDSTKILVVSFGGLPTEEIRDPKKI